MVWSPTLYSLVGFGAAGISAVVAGQAWRNRTQRGALSFMGLILALGGWSLVYAIQLGFTTPPGQLPWQRLSLAIGGTIPTLWLLFTVQYTGQSDWLTRGKRAGLLIDPFLFALLVITNPVHEFVWNSATLTPTRAGPVLHLSFVEGYYIHIAYAYLIVTIGLGLLFLLFERTAPLYRGQTGFLILGAVPPFAANIAYTLRVPWGPLPALDPTPFVFVLTGVLWALALFQFDLLHRTPIARERVIDEMGDGLIVLDTDGRIINANATADHALGPSLDAGRSVTEVIPEEAKTVDAIREALDGRTITATVDNRERAYDVEWSSFTDDRGTVVGHAVALRDVTDRSEYEQRLEVAQRILRHNLRNDMTVIRGRADHLVEATTNGQARAARQISETADELIDLSEKTQTMVQLETTESHERTSIDVQEHLSTLVEDFADMHPEVAIECEVPDSVEVSLSDEKFLLIPMENLIENAIEHNDADGPWVRVSVERIDGTVRIRVADNSPPIPEMEHEVFEKGEGPLQHGSGLGLWLTYWSVKAVGGSISFDDRDRRGNIVTIELPATRSGGS